MKLSPATIFYTSVDIDRIGRSPIGRLTPLKGFDARTGRRFDHFAYVPDELPESIELRDITHVRVAEAEAALARLDEAAHQLPIPELIRRPTTFREAHSTSALEGTYAPFEEVFEADLEQTRNPAVLEVLNYQHIAEEALHAIQSRPISIGFLSALHANLVRGTKSDSEDAGRLRRKPVMIGSPDLNIEDARFVPPPDGHWLEDGCSSWEKWVNEDHRLLPTVVAAALAHYQFETLHPYDDGNGRIGRLVIVLQLQRAGVLSDGILAVSPWFEQRRRSYQDHLYEVSCTGDWDPWVHFFASGLRDSADNARRRVKDLLSYGERIRTTVEERKWSGAVVKLAGLLIGYPVLTANWAAMELGVSYATANNAIKKLTDAGILDEITGRNYGRVFFAREVLAIAQS